MSLFFSGKCGSDPVLEVVARAVNKNTKEIENIKNTIASDEESLASYKEELEGKEETQNSLIESLQSSIDSINDQIQGIIDSTPVKYIVDLTEDGAIETYNSNYFISDTKMQEIEDNYDTVDESGRKIEVYIKYKHVVRGRTEPIYAISSYTGYLKVEKASLVHFEDGSTDDIVTYTASDGNSFCILNKVYVQIEGTKTLKNLFRYLNTIDIFNSLRAKHFIGEVVTDSLSQDTYILGDTNSNGYVDNSDVVALARTVMGETVEGFDKRAADTNEDGLIDTTDVQALANYVLGY